jgi:hypothetical protein
VTQLTTFVPLYSCNHNITLNMAVLAAETCGKNMVNEIHYKHRSAFGWLFVYYGPGLMHGRWNVLQ